MSKSDLNKRRVSVVIPIYNGGGFLQKAIDSVVAQTFTDWSLIVVDDGSTEDIESICAIYPRVRFMRRAHEGTSAARNAGIKADTSEFIAFLDADDVWHATKLEKQIELFDRNPSVGLCHTNFARVDKNGLYISDSGYQKIHATYSELLKGNTICASSVMVRRSCLDEVGLFDLSLPPAEDFDLWLRISRQFEIGYVPSVELSYREHAQGSSQNRLRMFVAEREIYRKHIRYAREQRDEEILRAAREGLSARSELFAFEFAHSARNQFSGRKNFRSGLDDVRKAFLASPKFVLTNMPKWALDSVTKRLSNRED